MATAWLRANPRRRVCRIGTDTALVIDGFWRSGNTFARTAFLEANPDLRVSTFVHNPYSVRQAAHHDRPMMLLIRTPADAVRSFLHYFPDCSPADGIAEYEYYYRRARPFLDQVVVADFDVVVADFSRVIAACNDRFGTAFRAYDQSPENDEEIFHAIDAGYANYTDFDGKVARPSERRRSRPDLLAHLDAGTERALAAANDLYRDIRRRSVGG